MIALTNTLVTDKDGEPFVFHYYTAFPNILEGCCIVSGALVLLCFEVFIDIKLDVYSYLMNNYIFD